MLKYLFLNQSFSQWQAYTRDLLLFKITGKLVLFHIKKAKENL